MRRLTAAHDTRMMLRIVDMMTYQRIGNYVTAEPFRPFRVNMVSGQSFEIRHPEMVQVGRTTMTIFTYMADSSHETKQREHEVSLLLIESVEAIASQTAA